MCKVADNVGMELGAGDAICDKGTEPVAEDVIGDAGSKPVMGDVFGDVGTKSDVCPHATPGSTLAELRQARQAQDHHAGSS